MDDDEDGFGDIGTNRYQTMPSLQALQQMRNRLHTAFLGKRLMKWTALACGKEMRILAGVLVEQRVLVMQDQFREAYLELARSRYFMPDLNALTLEGVEREAHTKVQTTPRFIAGAKLTNYAVVDLEKDGKILTPYLHFGIGKGGAQVNETKRKWRELLQNVVHMTELVFSYETVCKAFADATKKKNVMQKVVIPKTIHTIQYIQRELEELGREDFYRMKMIKNLKNKARAQLEKPKKISDEEEIVQKPSIRERRREQTKFFTDIGLSEEQKEEEEERLVWLEDRIPLLEEEFLEVCEACPEHDRLSALDEKFDKVSVKSIQLPEKVSFAEKPEPKPSKIEATPKQTDENISAMAIESLASELAKIITEVLVTKKTPCLMLDTLHKEIDKIANIVSREENQTMKDIHGTCSHDQYMKQLDATKTKYLLTRKESVASTSQNLSSNAARKLSSHEICSECLESIPAPPKFSSSRASRPSSSYHKPKISAKESAGSSVCETKPCTSVHTSGASRTSAESEELSTEKIFEEFRNLQQYIKSLKAEAESSYKKYQMKQIRESFITSSSHEESTDYPCPCDDETLETTSEETVVNIPIYLKKTIDEDAKSEKER